MSVEIEITDGVIISGIQPLFATPGDPDVQIGCVAPVRQIVRLFAYGFLLRAPVQTDQATPFTGGYGIQPVYGRQAGKHHEGNSHNDVLDAVVSGFEVECVERIEQTVENQGGQCKKQPPIGYSSCRSEFGLRTAQAQSCVDPVGDFGAGMPDCRCTVCYIAFAIRN